MGSLRFSPPRSPEPWRGARQSLEFAPVCPQVVPNLRDEVKPVRYEYLEKLLPYLKNQSEDCLYLNIYAPHQPEGKPTEINCFWDTSRSSWEAVGESIGRLKRFHTSQKIDRPIDVSPRYYSWFRLFITLVSRRRFLGWAQDLRREGYISRFTAVYGPRLWLLDDAEGRPVTNNTAARVVL